MVPRLLPLAVALTLAVVALSGCTPEPAPSPSATGFATEAEAFAAAEETYRAYVDALNQVDLSDPETFEAVYAWTTGDANAAARKSFTQMGADGWRVSGESRYDNFKPTNFMPDQTSTVTVEVCLDVTAVEVADSTGQSVVPPSRRDRQPAIVTFDETSTPSGLAIASSEATDGLACD